VKLTTHFHFVPKKSEWTYASMPYVYVSYIGITVSLSSIVAGGGDGVVGIASSKTTQPYVQWVMGISWR
jgi:hypothetical protein